MGNRKAITGLCVLLFAVLLGSCTGGGVLSPDVDRSPERRSSDYRTVLRGETLYSISWDVGVDFRTLAQWNHIGPPYLLRAGQRLRITEPGASGTGNSPGDSHVYTVVRGDTLYSISRRKGVSVRELIRRNGLKKPYVIRPGQRLRLAAPTDSSRPGRPRARRQTPPRIPVPHGRVRRVHGWIWPTKGAVVGGFSRTGVNKGIDIAGRRGSNILAASGGSVVYQGSGLRGYGKLIIIKHNADFLSAYAHCARILVRDGESVKRGQRIATMGSSGTNRVKLHFEIRLRGKPVNPLRYLPGKS
jgi:murein DD-endopeptidase MepM/ murein hydrolase activator NlpD